MKKIMKKTAIIMLAVAMAVTTGVPCTETASAASGAWDGSVDVSWFNPDKAESTSEYHLKTPEQLAGLAALVNGRTSYDCTGIKYPAGYSDKDYDRFFKAKKVSNFQLVGAGGGNTSDTVYLGSIDMDFDGVTFYLDDDMNMGGKYNWAPIGGKFPLDTRAFKTIKKTDSPSYAKAPAFNGDCQTIESYFNGALDGQGHDITNIYCDRYTNKGFPYSMAIGLVGYLGGVQDDYTDVSMMAEDWTPAVRNLTVSGSIYGRRMVGGIVGRIGDWPDGALVLNCGNRASVKSTDSRGRGGIVGSGGFGSGCKIVNCYNTGKITGTYNTTTGGIIGENDGCSIYNCYNAGDIKCSDQDYAMGIGGHDSGSYTVENCYYLKGCAGSSKYPGYFRGTGTGLTLNTYEMTKSEMTGALLYKSLNDQSENGFIGGAGAFTTDSKGINDGYPILFFEKEGFNWPYKECNVSVGSSGQGKVWSSQTGKVPYGTVICMSNIPAGGSILNKYTAGGKEISADCYTVTSDIYLSAEFKALKKGQVVFRDGKDYYISGKKSGTVDGTYEHTANMQIAKSMDKVFQNDVITAKAILNAGAKPDNPSREYTGDFEYIFKYSSGTEEKTSKGKHKVLEEIGSGGLTVSAEPVTRDKSWLSQADITWYSGSKNTFTIKKPEQLAGIAYLVNTKGETFKGKTIKLGSNITLENNDGTSGIRYWAAIGNSSAKSFQGTFDGNGKTIKKMSARSTGSYAGLFGYVKNAKIKNVTVRGSSTAVTGAAGVVAFAEASGISGCLNYCDITADGENAGGICSQISGKTVLTKCINRGNVTGRSLVGGVCGQAMDKSASVRNCANMADVTAAGTFAGGVTGKSYGDIRACANKGMVTAGDYGGGVCGHTSSWDIPLVMNSYNVGAVRTTGSGTAHLGGIIGYAQYINMKNCYNAGQVDSTSHSGGVAGMFYKSINNSIGSAYYSDECRTPLGDTEGEDREKVVTTSMSITAMKSAAFADKLNSSSAGTWVAVSGLTPELKWLVSETEPADPQLDPERHVDPVEVQKQYVRGGMSISGGSYHIDPTATGILEIKGSVTLDTAKGNPDGLLLYVGKGADLTLESVTLSGETTLIAMDGGTLTLKGNNKLKENCTEQGNENPAILVRAGTAVIQGSGSLQVQSTIGNTPVKLEKESKLQIKSGKVKLTMSERLGKSGGIIDGSSVDDGHGTITEKYGTVEVKGGTLTVTSDTNNVLCAAISKFVQNGGNTYFYAKHADSNKKRASYGKAANIDSIKVTGGKMTVVSTIHDSTKKVKGKEALQCKSIFGGSRIK